MRRTRHPTSRTPWIVLACLAGLLAGCSLARRRPPAMHEHALDYPTPDTHRLAPLAATLRVGRFFALAPYDSTAILHRTAQGEIDALTSDRWVAPPAAQVGDLLYRDLAASALFAGVFRDASPEPARFRVEGSVDRFGLEREGQAEAADLALTVTVLDTRAPETNRRILLQRRFTATQPATDSSAGAAVAASSQALRRLSGQILEATHRVVEQRLAGSRPPPSEPASRPTPPARAGGG